ncbi:Glyoxalase-like domain protein [compost metagenome]
MEQRVSLITLGVSELERSRLFYTEGLGWTPGFVSDEVVFFQAGPLIVSLFPFAALAEDAQVPVAAGSAGFALAHNVRSKAEVDAVLARAEAAGARLRSPAQEKPWGGYAGYFTDPDGHLWEIAWNPGFAFTPDGGVLLGG